MKRTVSLAIIACLMMLAPACQSQNGAIVFVENFYKWYLENVYLTEEHDMPEFKELEAGYFQLDTTAYFEFLRSSGYFSEGFFDSERAAIEVCNSELRNIPSVEAQDYAIPSEGIFECRFMEYQRWVGCQGEQIKSVEMVSSSQLTNGQVKVIVFLCDSVEVLVSEDMEFFKIDKIQVR